MPWCEYWFDLIRSFPSSFSIPFHSIHHLTDYTKTVPLFFSDHSFFSFSSLDTIKCTPSLHHQTHTIYQPPMGQITHKSPHSYGNRPHHPFYRIHSLSQFSYIESSCSFEWMALHTHRVSTIRCERRGEREEKDGWIPFRTPLPLFPSLNCTISIEWKKGRKLTESCSIPLITPINTDMNMRRRDNRGGIIPLSNHLTRERKINHDIQEYFCPLYHFLSLVSRSNQ